MVGFRLASWALVGPPPAQQRSTQRTCRCWRRHPRRGAWRASPAMPRPYRISSTRRLPRGLPMRLLPRSRRPVRLWSSPVRNPQHQSRAMPVDLSLSHFAAVKFYLYDAPLLPSSVEHELNQMEKCGAPTKLYHCAWPPLPRTPPPPPATSCPP